MVNTNYYKLKISRKENSEAILSRRRRAGDGKFGMEGQVIVTLRPPPAKK
jgi:hypothetical protein